MLKNLIVLAVFCAYCSCNGYQRQLCHFVAQELIVIHRITEEQASDLKTLGIEDHNCWRNYLNGNKDVQNSYYPATTMIRWLSLIESEKSRYQGPVINSFTVDNMKLLIHIFQFSIMNKESESSVGKTKIDELTSFLSGILYEIVRKYDKSPDKTKTTTSTHLNISEETKSVIRKVIWKDSELLIPDKPFKDFVDNQIRTQASIIYGCLTKEPFSRFNPEPNSWKAPERFQEFWVGRWNAEWNNIKSKFEFFFEYNEPVLKEMIGIIYSEIH